jgi:ribose transport system ATP-binding protein
MNSDNKNLILAINNVSKSFPGVKALNDVSLFVQRGHVHGIVGENGAGKSTLMKVLSGVHKPDSGSFTFDGQLVTETNPIASIKMGLSIIYQEFNLVNMMSVGENIFLGRFKELNGMKGTHKKARELLDSIGSTINTHSLVNDLSVSEKQMVEIAKALSFDSKLIIMDEPSSSLTQGEMERLISIIHNLKSRGITILYISHKLDEIFELCDTVTIMRDGNMIDTKPTSQLTRSEMIAKMIGRSIEQEYPERPRCSGETIMKVANVTTRKLKAISFELKKGEILGLVGLVGAGRTELVRAIFGADKVAQKEIVIDGQSVRIRNPKDGIEAGMGFVTEDRKELGLVLKFSVEDNIAMGNLDKLKKGLFVNGKLENKMAKRQIDALSIKTPSSKTKVRTLSGGNQQKVIVGRWLEIDPKILILDEPTRGIDVGAKYEIYLLMKKIVEAGGSILFISSELPEVLSMSNRVLTLSDGRLTGEFDPEKIDAQIIMESAIG